MDRDATCIDLLCSDPCVTNMGDVATALATANGLAERGIPVRRIAHCQGRQTIVGGGDLVGDYDHGHLYRVPGPHLLNAVGVRSDTGPIDHLREYAYISVRDHVSAERLADKGINAYVVPCPATLIEPLPWEVACTVPRWGLLPHMKDYIVIHARPELTGIANGSRSMKVIAIEPAPYTWLPWEAHGWLLPVTHSPELIATVLSRARAVVTLSLHLSILALAVGVPFCCPTKGHPDQQAKLKNYWTRARIPEVIYSGNHPVQHALSLRTKLREIRERERMAVNRHLDQMAEITLRG